MCDHFVKLALKGLKCNYTLQLTIHLIRCIEFIHLILKPCVYYYVPWSNVDNLKEKEKLQCKFSITQNQKQFSRKTPEPLEKLSRDLK